MYDRTIPQMTIDPGFFLLQATPDAFALGDFWSLTQQAGPLRWPIFFVLAFGLASERADAG